jgi:hypothetical protein
MGLYSVKQAKQDEPKRSDTRQEAATTWQQRVHRLNCHRQWQQHSTVFCDQTSAILQVAVAAAHYVEIKQRPARSLAPRLGHEPPLYSRRQRSPLPCCEVASRSLNPLLPDPTRRPASRLCRRPEGRLGRLLCALSHINTKAPQSKGHPGAKSPTFDLPDSEI